MESTLQDLRKRKFKTIKAFAEAAHLTEYQASNWLRCRWSDADETPLIALLGVTREQYGDARMATYEYEEKVWREKHPPATPEQIAAHNASIKATTDKVWSKMSDADKRRVHEQAVAMGLTQEQRSPLDILIDRAVGKE